MHRLIWPALLAIALGCGMPGGRALTDLNDDDWYELCNELREPPKTVSCEIDGETIDVTVGKPENESCDPSELGPVLGSCQATVADVRDCAAATYDDPCLLVGDTVAPECQAYWDCLPTD